MKVLLLDNLLEPQRHNSLGFGGDYFLCLVFGGSGSGDWECAEHVEFGGGASAGVASRGNDLWVFPMTRKSC